MPGHTVGLLESNQTVKETVAEMYEKFSKAIREMKESLALLEERISRLESGENHTMTFSYLLVL